MVLNMPEKFDLAYYLTKLKNHKVEPLEKVLQKDGQLNDIDYHLAEHLAVSVIEEEPFEPVSDRAFERAKQMIRQCKKVINAGIVIGTTNRKIKELLVFAEEMGKLESYEK